MKGREWTFHRPEKGVIPKSIEDITERKYREISEEAKKVLEIASVIGYFDIDMLSEFTGFNEGHILGLLDELVSRGFVKEGEERIEFKEGISREMIYEKHVGKIKGRVYHKKVADYLLSQYTEKTDSIIMEVANHLYLARDYERGPSYLLKAAMAARAQYSYDVAISYLKKALSLGEGRWSHVDLLLDIYQELIDVLHFKGNNPEAFQIVEKALDLVKNSGGERHAAFYQRKAILLYSVSKFKESVQYAEMAKKLYEKLGSKTGVAHSLNIMGIAKLFEGDYELAEEFLKSARDVFVEIGEKEGIASVYNNLGAVYDRLGRLEEALSAYEESLKIAEEFKDLKGKTLLLHNIGSVYLDLGDLDRAEKYLNDSLILAERLGDYSSMANCYLLLGLLYKERSEFAKSLEYYRKCAFIADFTGNTNLLAWSKENTGEIYYMLGKMEEAERFFKEVQRMTRDIGNTYLSFYNLLDTARLYLERGHYSKAEEILKTMQQLVDKTGSLRLKEDYLLTKAELYVLKDDIENAVIVLEEIENKDFHFHMLRAEIFLKQGRFIDALSEISTIDAEKLSEFYRMKIDTLRARIYIALGKNKEALTILANVKSFYERIGAKPRLKEVEKLIEEAV